MNSTSPSLLSRLKDRQDAQAWQCWLTVYEPWLRSWLGRQRLQSADVDDIFQDILVVVSGKLPEFVHGGQRGSFRAWLRSILVNRVRDFLRGQRLRTSASDPAPDWVDLLEDPASELTRQWEHEHDQQLARRLLAAVQADFQPRTWEAFRLLVLEDLPAVEVAQRCRMQLASVYAAKSRVLARLRQELCGLLGP